MNGDECVSQLYLKGKLYNITLMSSCQLYVITKCTHIIIIIFKYHRIVRQIQAKCIAVLSWFRIILERV